MAQIKTPGVYVVERNAFPNSVVEVATSIPAFIGYTEKAARGKTPLTNVPTRISSMQEYGALFGGAPLVKVNLAEGTHEPTIDPQSRFLMYLGLRMFFENGGSACWVVSVGGYGNAEDPILKSKTDFEEVWKPLAKEAEPALVVVPDAVLLPHNDWADVSNKVLRVCAQKQDRFAILDVFDGDQSQSGGAADIIDGTKGFRTMIHTDDLSFGAAYYPWLNTSLLSVAEVTFVNLTKAGATILHDAVQQELSAKGPIPDDLKPVLQHILDIPDAPAAREKTHNILMAISTVYADIIRSMLGVINTLPPSSAMAGLYARTDNFEGVFASPANQSLVSVVGVTASIDNTQQADLNASTDGKAINAIRSFHGQGILVWGARTLDGNSLDYRYVSVRRTLIMLEQSMKGAAFAYAFAPNTADTWATLKASLENFLTGLWTMGGLMGTKPADAFSVDVGLAINETSPSTDMMQVVIKAALVRPAEFKVISFVQEMQTS